MTNARHIDQEEALPTIPARQVTLRDVVKDCGGTVNVASALRVAKTTVYDWVRRGRVPDSDLKRDGGTSYSDTIASMQKTGTLSAAQIRRLGRRI